MVDETPEYVVIRYWLNNSREASYRLASGVGLAFRPPGGERPFFLLAASRVGGYPGTHEIERVEGALQQALDDLGVVVDPERPLLMRKEMVNGAGVCRWRWVVKRVRL